jgi:hypothetical protein
MIILQRLSYFIFAVFVSTLFVYLIHRTFTPNDIINIPVLAIIIYLIINYSAEITYEKNLEKFLNQQSDSSISDMMENFDGAGSSLLKKLSAFSEEEEANRQQNQGDQSISLPASQIQMEEENKPSIPAPQIFQQEEEARQAVYQPRPQEEEARQAIYQPQPQEEEARRVVYQPRPQEEEAPPRPNVYQPQPQEEENKYYNIIGEKNPKEKQAKKKQSKRPNINKHLETELNTSVNPININVSYNNPVAVNGFNIPDTNMNKYQFDSGLFGSRNNGKYFDSIDDSINSTYYPSYLNNPLNYNVGGTQIPAIRQESNYEQDRQKQILTEKNNPSPVMFGDEWSEWAPV